MIQRKFLEIASQLRGQYLKFITDVMRHRLSRSEKRIVELFEENNYIAISSGHAMGKDHVSACIALAFFQMNGPCKVICTGPTERQAIEIVMAEIATIFTECRNKGIPLGGELQTTRIVYPGRKDYYLLAFKAADKNIESWSGFHSNRILVLVTEASWIPEVTLDAIRGILTGEVAKLLMVANPNINYGRFYEAFSDPKYATMRISCFNSPNVRAKKILIPGMVNYEWVKDMVNDFATEIPETEFHPEAQDIKFDGKYYRPGPVLMRRVMGLHVDEGESERKIPLAWIEASFARWKALQDEGRIPDIALTEIIGLDPADEGENETVWCFKWHSIIIQFKNAQKINQMQIVAQTQSIVPNNENVKIVMDANGVGAGSYARFKEIQTEGWQPQVIPIKSPPVKMLRDFTGLKTFHNYRAYSYQCVHDALNPLYGINIALPENKFLKLDLLALELDKKSNGDIIAMSKDEMKLILKGRSPDYLDALALAIPPSQGSVWIYKKKPGLKVRGVDRGLLDKTITG